MAGTTVLVDAVDFDADHAMLIKIFANDWAGAGRYGPPKCVGTQTRVIKGNPDPDLIKTSFAERRNLIMRMSMRCFTHMRMSMSCFTQLINVFSKKFENHRHALVLYLVFYNFRRVHRKLGVIPAMAAGVAPVCSWRTWLARSM
jgi:hypothetical protein